MGRALLAALITGLAACSADRQNIRAADLPAPVQATLEHEAAGGKIGTITKETTTAGVTYRADVDATNGQKWDVKIDGAGKLMYKHVE